MLKIIHIYLNFIFCNVLSLTLTDLKNLISTTALFISLRLPPDSPAADLSFFQKAHDTVPI